MSKLTIHRKAYTTKRGTHVSASTFSVKDRGAKGRTPKSEQWYAPKTHTGWRKEQSATYRRKLVLGAHKGVVLAAARSMQALANVTTDKQTKREAQADAKYFYAKLKKSK